MIIYIVKKQLVNRKNKQKKEIPIKQSHFLYSTFHIQRQFIVLYIKHKRWRKINKENNQIHTVRCTTAQKYKIISMGKTINPLWRVTIKTNHELWGNLDLAEYWFVKIFCQLFEEDLLTCEHTCFQFPFPPFCWPALSHNGLLMQTIQLKVFKKVQINFMSVDFPINWQIVAAVTDTNAQILLYCKKKRKKRICLAHKPADQNIIQCFFINLIILTWDV